MASPLRTIGLVTLVAVVGLVAAGGVIVLVSASPGSCPTALLEGTLEVEPARGDLVVRTEDGHVVSVSWPIGYGIGGGPNGEPVLTRVFMHVAKPGDRVAVGGGEGRTADFDGCGVIGVTPGPPSPEPRQPDLDPSIGPQG